ncbi:MAG: hypothetical protein M1830_001038, partial [Pleopsidium flavum]
MQPEPTEVSQETSSTQKTPGTQNAYLQHGLQNYDELGSRPLSREEERDEPSCSGEADASEPDKANPDKEDETSVRWMRPDSSPRTRSPVDRIVEYEKASNFSTKRNNEGPGFKIVEKSKKARDNGSPISISPNEVLTHILSHLPPASLSAVSLVSHRFHSLVTTPHAWRIAFSRFFPGSDVLATLYDAHRVQEIPDDEAVDLRSEKRVFTRLTALASWRSEYILRTRLLRSLGRGKPAQFQGAGASGSSRSNTGHSGNAQITYNSNFFTTINHLHATFGTGLNKRLPRFIHGADEIGAACTSDPNLGKVDNWGFSDPQSFLQFVDRFPGDAQHGLGPGDVVGVPNVMDVSQSYGMVYGEGSPGGLVYYRSTEEQRGRFLAFSIGLTMPELGIPKVIGAKETMCSVWIAKTTSIPTLTEGVIGILSGSSHGIVTSYSLGTNGLQDRRIERGEITARWVLSPGVPIIAIAVDEEYSSKRRTQRRIWAIVLNALGEVFYLTDLTIRAPIERGAKLDEGTLERLAWATGRTVHWTLVEPTRRISRPDPFSTADVDGSYSPRSSWNCLGLSKEQLIAESQEVEKFLNYKPKHFRAVCEGWDMRRRLEVDFAGDDEHGAGESIVIFDCGLDEGQIAGIKRYTRCNFSVPSDVSRTIDEEGLPYQPSATPPQQVSLFGGPMAAPHTWSFSGTPPRRRGSVIKHDFGHAPSYVEEWRTSEYALGGLKSTQITATAIDMSRYAGLTTSEDPLLSLSGSSTASSPMASPLGQRSPPSSPSDVPGQRARFLAAGTKTGTILIWNLRAPTSNTSDLINTAHPVRIVHTDSPQISCLALTSLYLVHGGNDGLVQAWDPLASNTQPVRTLNSRFSSRARRRLVQAEASARGVGINLFAAGALCLDPDPTVLRGMVSLGTHLRYWSYSSTAADQYKSSKRRLRRSQRGSNNSGERFSGTGRGALKDYIANEKYELEKEKENRQKDADRLA